MRPVGAIDPTGRESIPACLRERPQWVMWRRVQRHGAKPTKIPFMTNGGAASHSAPATWTTFEACAAALEQGRFDGLGFVFSASDPFAGIDLDGCYQSDGTLKAWAVEVVAAAQEAEAYIERTPSGLGLHIIGRGIVGAGRKRAFDGGAVEMYDRDRYFTVSGEQISLGDAAADVTQVLALTRRQFGLAESGAEEQVTAGADVPDYEADKLTAAVLEHASGEFLQFWGDKIDTGAHGGDRSAHRLGLLNRLAMKLWSVVGREPTVAELRAVALRSLFIRNEMHRSRGKWPRLAVPECGKALTWARENRVEGGGVKQEAAPVELSATPFEWVDPARLPPRRWLFGQHYIRRFLTATVAPGGVGKSSLVLAEAVAMALGRNLFDRMAPLPSGPLRVWCYALEDPADEIQRRLTAILMHYGINARDLGGRLFVSSGRDQPLIVAAEDRGSFVAMPRVEKELVAELQRKHIDVLQLDPYVSTHRVSENDNTRQDAITQIWKRVSDAADCSVEMIHHTRKSNGAEVSADDMRGAVAVRDACRAVRVISPMSEAEAQKLNIEVERRRFYFYAQDVKANLTPPVDSRQWFHLASVDLGNGDGTYPADKIGVVEPWTLPDALDDVSAQDVVSMVAELRRMGEADLLKRAAFNAASDGWFGHVVGGIVGLDTHADEGARARVKRMLNAWIKAGVLEKFDIRDAKKGRSRPCFRPGKAA
jgi:hypothetical protein